MAAPGPPSPRSASPREHPRESSGGAPASSTRQAGSRFVASLVAAGAAEAVSLPLDVLKVRLQVMGGHAERHSIVALAASIRREEGATALWKGLPAALLRQCLYTSMSLVIYEPLRNAIVGENANPTFAQRLLAGGSAGALAITVFNWTEVIKTQQQASRGRERESIRSVARRVYRTDGVWGFWRGVRPNVARTFLVNAAELGTYDQAKTELMVPLVGDNAFAHLGASGLAGFASAAVSTPADVVKTRMMASAGGHLRALGEGGVAPSIAGSLALIVREEGFFGLYRGFVPVVFRKLVWCSVFFVSFERLRAVLVQ